MIPVRDYNSQHQREYIVLPLLAVFSFMVLLIVSPDSWLHAIWDHHDSAWFFTCGKAWMSGMTPYVDFADSKGPLLWLIYGIGYLMSPRDFIGVFWISCIWYTAIFYYCYKMAMLYLHDSGKAFLATMCMAIFFFFPGVHYEVRAEDFNLLFSTISIYYVCRLTSGYDVPLRAVRRAPWAVGACLGATFLIKYNVTLMLLMPAIVVLAAARRHRQSCWQSLWRMAAGAVMVLLPFVVYMACVGCLDDFVREYFVNTYATLRNTTYKPTHAYCIIRHNFQLLQYITAVSVLMLLAFGRLENRWKLVLIFAWYCILVINNAHWVYYYESISVFALFGIIALLQFNFPKCLVTTICVVAFVGIPAALGAKLYCLPDVAWFNNHDVQRADFNRCVKLMSEVERPRVLYYLMNGSYDIPVDGLPACRYWASQNGSTPLMDSIQVSTIERREVDFVFMMPRFEMNARMDSLGYDRYDSHCDEIMVMYKKRN